jgi:hypothetical protein
MSVRAYKIIEKRLADNPSFNLWHDEEIYNFIIEHPDTQDNLDEDGGVIETSVKVIKELLKKVKMPKEYKDGFKQDIKGLLDDNWIEYECF